MKPEGSCPPVNKLEIILNMFMFKNNPRQWTIPNIILV
jgi:hypothetical protein